MMRWANVVPIWLVGALLACQSPVQAQSGDWQSSVSLERIRAALNKEPPRLQIPAPSGDGLAFHVEVRERLYVLRPIDETPVDPTFGLPSVGELLTEGLAKVHSAVVTYKRGRAERRAREEVEDALAAFCAVRECPAPLTSR